MIAAPRLDDAADRLVRELLGVPFGRLDARIADTMNARNRGWIGQWLERRLGLRNHTAALDFADGELKTFESARGWLPVHGQVAVGVVDDPDALVVSPSFEDSVVAAKLARTLFAGYRKPTADPRDWYVAFVLVYARRNAPRTGARLGASYDAIVRRFAADARHADELSVAHDHTYREDLLILKNKDSRQDGRYASGWSSEFDAPIAARRLGFYLTPAFFELLAGDRAELLRANESGPEAKAR